MFYHTEHSPILRLGDVVKGYISTRPTIKKPYPFTKITEQLGTINVELPSYCVVLSPCCSNDSGIISLTPLIKLDNKILKVPYFKEDPTRINQEVEPKLSVPPYVWDRPEFQEERQRLLAKGPGYVFNDYFVYENNDIFVEYTADMKEEDNLTTNYYMIDFRNIYSLLCNMIKRERDLTAADTPLIESKILELSV